MTHTSTGQSSNRCISAPPTALGVLVSGFAALLFALLFATAAPAAPGDYELGPEDKLMIRVFEWRAQIDKVLEWSALNGEFTVSGSGLISMPLIGPVKAAGRTTSEVAQDIARQLRERMKLGDAPVVAAEVVQYRPFYVAGSVAKPGSYPYRPGMTVLQAMSIAGGLPRPDENGFMRLGREVISGRGAVSELGLKIKELLARKARLAAELQGVDGISFSPSLLKDKGDPRTAAILRQERTIFDARRTALKTQVATLERLKAYLSEEVKSLQAQLKLKQKELSIVVGELTNVSKLVEKGLSVASRQFALERLAAQLSSDRLRLETAVLKAQQEISRTDVAIEEARNTRAIEVASKLRSVEAELEQTSQKYETQQRLLYDSEVTVPRLVASRRRDSKQTEPTYTIIRPRVEGEPERIEASELTLVEPGDTIKVELPLPDDLSSILGLPASPTQ